MGGLAANEAGAQLGSGNDQDGFMSMMHNLLSNDANYLHLNSALGRVTDNFHDLGVSDLDRLICLSLDSHSDHAQIPGKKKDIRKQIKFQQFLLAGDSNINIMDSTAR